MATIKYFIRNKKSIKPTSINFDIHLSANTRLRGTTTYKITPKFWDKDGQKVRNKIEVSNIKDNINNKLSKLKSFIFEKLSEYKNNNQDEILIKLKEDIAIYLGKKSKVENEILSFYPFTEKFIYQSKNRVVEKTGRTITLRTIQDYLKTVELLKKFEKTYNYPISYNSINLDFYYKFIEYLEKLDYSANTIGKIIKILKVFLNSASEQGFNNNFAYKSKHFIKPSTTSEHIYLSIDELKKIQDLDLSNNIKYDNARDLFLIGSFTGLRVSDFNGLTKENIKVIDKIQCFTLIVKKTGKYLPIPIHPIVSQILNKRNGNPPKKMTSQNINNAIKEIGKLARIDEIITINSIKGGKKESLKKFKYELISSHTARRSFCTNAYKNDMPIIDIMAISNHSSAKTFLNYIKITADERAVKIANNPFFQIENTNTKPP